MVKINKRPIVIQDLIEQATYIAEDNLDASDRFLRAAIDILRVLHGSRDLEALLEEP
jgi:toxin ParE1/3/4